MSALHYKRGKNHLILEQLYKEYYKSMSLKAYHILKDHQLAEDAVQQAFLKISDSLDKISNISSPRTKKYLMVTVKNSALDIYRKNKKRRTIYFEELFPSQICTYDTISEYFYHDSFRHTLQLLPYHYALIIAMYYHQGLSAAEIAQMLHMTECNVRKRLSRGRQKLLALLRQKGLF